MQANIVLFGQPGVMASTGNVQEGPTLPLTSPRLGSTNITPFFYASQISAFLHLIELQVQGIKLFVKTNFIFRPIHIDSQVYELPKNELGWHKQPNKRLLYLLITTTSRVSPANCPCFNKFADIHSKSQISGKRSVRYDLIIGHNFHDYLRV